ncbi:hypothetical protein LG314_05285 [Agrococcus terreus]|uniref:hypothetical protein n=1 Tax=Agrococcus terreus TaxID=574649 RepID=UPI00384AD8EF
MLPVQVPSTSWMSSSERRVPVDGDAVADDALDASASVAAGALARGGGAREAGEIGADDVLEREARPRVVGDPPVDRGAADGQRRAEHEVGERDHEHEGCGDPARDPAVDRRPARFGPPRHGAMPMSIDHAWSASLHRSACSVGILSNGGIAVLPAGKGVP